MDNIIHDNALMAESPWHFCGLALRDFFSAGTGESIQQAGMQLLRQFPEKSFFSQTEHQIDWLAVEYDFNRLFVGPGVLKAAPYASVWLDEDAQLMSASTHDIRALYQALGLFVPDNVSVPDDHIAYELEVTVLLHPRRQQSPYSLVWQWFVLEHVNRWLPLFIGQIKNNASTAFIQNLAFLLEYFLSELNMEKI